MRLFILCISLCFSIAASANERRVENYLNSIESFSADFAQLDPDGNSAKGRFYLAKPGKFRWEYEDKPLLIVSNGELLTYFDEELNEVTYVNAKETLASILARDEIKFRDDIKLIEYSEKGAFIKTVLTQKGKQEEGSLALYFRKDPMQITMMEVIDQNGDVTKVFFDNQDFSAKIDEEKFIFRDPNFHKNAWE